MELRDLLRTRGVHVLKWRNMLIADALVAAKEQKLLWPDEDEDAPDNPLVSRPKEVVSCDTPLRRNKNSKVSKAIANVSRMYYHDKEHYTGKQDVNLEHKVRIFKERDVQKALNESEMPKAFSVILSGRALQYYFDEVRGKRLTFERLCNGIRNLFLA